MKLFNTQRLFIVTFFILLISCVKSDDKNKLIGKWVVVWSEFDKDGMRKGTEYNIDKQKLHITKFVLGFKTYYAISGDTISYSIGADIVMATFKIENNKLKLNIIGSNKRLEFEKK